jgi:hypothetical protein
MFAASAPPVATLQTAYSDPDLFVLRWHRESTPYSLVAFLALALTALSGTLTYGAVLALGQSPQRILESALLNSAAATIAWAAPLPALYILGSLSGMRARVSTVFLASLTTAAWGGMALLAMSPIAAVFAVAYPTNKTLALFIHAISLIFTAASMACIFGRIVDRIEPGQGGGRVWWLFLFVLLKVQLMSSFGILRFTE